MYRGVWRAYLDRLRRLVRLAGVLGEARMGRELLLALLALLLVRLLLLHRRHRGRRSWSWELVLLAAVRLAGDGGLGKEAGVSFLAVAVSQDVVSVRVVFSRFGRLGGKSRREQKRAKRR